MARLLRLIADPLVLFLCMGAACFALYDHFNDDTETIVVTAEVVDALAADFLLLQGRPPNAAERRALIDRHVEDQLLFREALARGLHLADPRIQHRLTDKLRFLLTDDPPPPEPQALREFYGAHLETYRTDLQLSFEHRFFSREAASAGQLPEDAIALLDSGGDVTAEPFWLGDRFDRYDATILRSMFGPAFTDALAAAPLGTWIGPLASTRGLHLVRVDERRPSELIPFEDAR
ncbi:MAG: peptidylprolyl isomerase, partial [Pseudomonadales bacterium]|nr:peptidylprolyl isomerase [Pseudomonadales bacterium]